MTFSQIGQVYLLWDFIKNQKLGFWAIIWAPETLESRSGALTTLIVAYSFHKNLSQKISSLGWRQGPVISVKYV